MKWHKLESGFWDSETAHILEAELGPRGIIAYLRIVGSIAREIQIWEEVQHAHDVGWTKSLRDWSFVCKSSSRFVLKMLILLDRHEKMSAVPVNCECTASELRVNSHVTHLCKMSALTRFKLNFKNFKEFVHRDALGSNKRKFEKKDSIESGGPAGGPTGVTRREEIRNPPLPPIGGMPKMGASKQEKARHEARQKALAKEILEKKSADRGDSPYGSPDRLGQEKYELR